ncbi:MAG: methyltransferase [Actinobacteria bacterium]|uniref:Unannotated protein n=1 Tax=freshwater metagenome TaxID=449393 RepID=A0A6J7UJR4_9ZZZZ|nr:methyltransferase [Actinomycetota bacterium]
MTDDDLSLDRLTADVSVFQRKKGHRFSSDDMVTAWTALQVCPTPARALDLGCGLGSVLLHLAWSVPTAILVGIEAQEVSFDLLERNVAHNSLAHRVTVHLGDFQDPTVRLAAGSGFGLVTGTPPYFPAGTASDAADEQRMRARMETRGGIEAYVGAGAALMADDGWLVLCGDSDADTRLHGAAVEHGLYLWGRVVFVPRSGRPPLFSVWCLRKTPTELLVLDRVLTPRDLAGNRTADARMLRAFSGFPEAGTA